MGNTADHNVQNESEDSNTIEDYDEKKDEYIYKEDNEYCAQESIVHGDGDHRQSITESDRKEEYIIKCIGQLETNYKYIERGYDQKPSWGTATVFYTNNQKPQKCYVITAAHNAAKQIFECKECNKFTDIKTITKYGSFINKNCKHCSSVKLRTKTIHATKIQFRRREIEINTSNKNEDGDIVRYSFGDNRKCYQCKCEYIHYLYDIHPFPKSGYDWSVLSFVNSDEYNYPKYCKNIRMECKMNEMKNKKLSTFYIFGYPMQEIEKRYKMFGDQSTACNYDVLSFKRTKQLFFKQQEIDTSGGQSGSAIWYKAHNNKHNIGDTIIFAIHSGGSDKHKYNVATLIDDFILMKVEQLRIHDEITNSKTYKNGNKYVGQSNMEGKRHGYGKYIWSSEAEMYEGQWKDGEKHGYGKYQYACGDIYEGMWKNDKKNGHGKFTFQREAGTAEVFAGVWSNNVKNGRGVYFYANGDVYDGGWKDNKRHGKGKVRFADGSSYIGQYRNDRRNGKGKYVYPNGDIFEGSYEDGLKNGHGIISYANGDKFKGGFKDNKPHGAATYIYADGTQCEYTYSNGNKM
eukprot:203758_1